MAKSTWFSTGMGNLISWKRSPQTQKFQWKEREMQTNKDKPVYILHREVKDTAQKEQDSKIKFTCSYMEIYNELVFDLLSPKESFGDTLTIYQDSNNSKFIVKDKIQMKLKSVEDAMKVIQKGEKNILVRV